MKIYYIPQTARLVSPAGGISRCCPQQRPRGKGQPCDWPNSTFTPRPKLVFVICRQHATSTFFVLLEREYLFPLLPTPPGILFQSYH